MKCFGKYTRRNASITPNLFTYCRTEHTRDIEYIDQQQQQKILTKGLKRMK